MTTCTNAQKRAKEKLEKYKSGDIITPEEIGEGVSTLFALCRKNVLKFRGTKTGTVVPRFMLSSEAEFERL